MFSPNSRFTPNNSVFPSNSQFNATGAFNSGFGIGVAPGSFNQGMFGSNAGQFFDPALQGSLGLSGLDVGANLGFVLDSQANRLQISSLDRNALGAAAGFRVGDQILGVNRTAITSQQAFQSQLTAALQSEGRAWVAVDRNGNRQWINVDPLGRSRGLLGVHVFDDGGAVRVDQLSPRSVALRAGLQPGDVILSLNGAQLTSNSQLSEIARTAAAGNGELQFVVRRNGYEQTIHANVQQQDLAPEVAVQGAPSGNEAKASSRPPTLIQLRARSEQLRSKLRGLLERNNGVSGVSNMEAQATAKELLQTLEAIERPRQ